MHLGIKNDLQYLNDVFLCYSNFSLFFVVVKTNLVLTDTTGAVIDATSLTRIGWNVGPTSHLATPFVPISTFLAFLHECVTVQFGYLGLRDTGKSV